MMRRALYIAMSIFYSLATAFEGSFSSEQVEQWLPVRVPREYHNNAALNLTPPARRDEYEEAR
jgi:hypothetical protein